MSLSITTLNNEAAVAKTFTNVGSNLDVHKWFNATDKTTSFDNNVTIKQSIIGKDKATGVAIRRSLVQITAESPAHLSGLNLLPNETITVNVTVTTPTALSNLTATNRKDVMAFVRNLLTATFLEQLASGEI
jgi:hypothetical protein